MTPATEPSRSGARARSQVIIETIDSAALRGNPLQDPHRREVPIYLPPGYDEQSSRRYATVYLLPSYPCTGAMEMNVGPWQETIQQRLDRLIAARRIPPVVVVLPDFFTRYGGSQYLNSSAVGDYADHLLELVAFVDQRLRTRADRESRALCGKSSGGYGSLVTAMRRPDLFSMVADHSGDKGFELCYRYDFPRFAQALARIGDLEALLQDPAAARYRFGIDTLFYALNTPAMAACYSPNPQARLGFDLPVDPYTCEVDEAVWQRWLRHDPLQMIDEHQAALRSLRLLYLDCGAQDEHNLHYGCRTFSRRLQARGIAHRYEEFEGGHRGTQLTRYDVSLSAIGQVLLADGDPPL